MTTHVSTIDPIRTGEPDHHAAAAANQEFGFWLYLMSDLILFGTLFVTFVVLGHSYAGAPTGKELFDLPYVFAETMLLLFSSAACGLAVRAAGRGRKDLLAAWLALTFLLGLGFISMEFREFHRMIHEGNGPDRSAFLSAFFALVGTHGLHVFFGLIWMTVMMGQAAVKGLTMPVQSRLFRFGMFWHFLDIVWVGVFTVVYLMGVM